MSAACGTCVLVCLGTHLCLRRISLPTRQERSPIPPPFNLGHLGGWLSPCHWCHSSVPFSFSTCVICQGSNQLRLSRQKPRDRLELVSRGVLQLLCVFYVQTCPFWCVCVFICRCVCDQVLVSLRLWVCVCACQVFPV